jgi:hypothetical protein
MKTLDLYLWQNITLHFKATTPISSTGIVIPFDVQIAFPNPGPLQLDIGIIKLKLLNAGDTILLAGNEGSFLVRNNLNGGNRRVVKNMVRREKGGKFNGEGI